MPRPEPVAADGELLARLPLPDHDGGDSKYERGRETPGAVLLAGVAALRAGAGRLRIATVASTAPALAVSVPEARVVPLAETADGAIDPGQADRVGDLVDAADAVLLGPGMVDVKAAAPLLDVLTAALAAGSGGLVVDAGALPSAGANPDWIRRLAGRALLTPNPAELAALGGGEPSPATTLAAARSFGAVVACRGAVTWIAEPGGRVIEADHGDIGLATSGSGDVVSGLAAGLAARGADPLTVAVWAAAAHGRAGTRLSLRVAPVGYLAREIADELPHAIADLQRDGA
jgi:ADP-dependent NAD(P)H-hydrate dehydratase